MTAEELQTLLKELGACKEAVRWARGKSLAEAWEQCAEPSWMMWLCWQMEGREGWPDRKQVVLAACACAEEVLPIFEQKHPEDKRPRKAIEVARLWVEGKATRAEVRQAADAAYAAGKAKIASVIRENLRIPVSVKAAPGDIAAVLRGHEWYGYRKVCRCGWKPSMIAWMARETLWEEWAAHVAAVLESAPGDGTDLYFRKVRNGS